MNSWVKPKFFIIVLLAKY